MYRKLAFELVPQTMWGQNLRSAKFRNIWLVLRPLVMKDRCDICSSVTGPFHCHEKWEYVLIESVHMQRLLGAECCCVDCHDIHHIGHTNAVATKSRLAVLKRHYCNVNSCTLEDYEIDKHEAFEVWRERSLYYWRLDVSKALELISRGKL